MKVNIVLNCQDRLWQTIMSKINSHNKNKIHCCLEQAHPCNVRMLSYLNNDKLTVSMRRNVKRRWSKNCTSISKIFTAVCIGSSLSIIWYQCHCTCSYATLKTEKNTQRFQQSFESSDKVRWINIPRHFWSFSEAHYLECQSTA